MIDRPGSLRAAAEAARDAAARHLGEPALYSVLVDLRETSAGLQPVTLRFGFQQVRRRLIGGETLRACWVDVDLDPPALRSGPVSTFGRGQLGRLASVPGLPFPPPRLDLDELRLEPAGVLRAVAERSFGPGPDPGRVDLSLCRHDGHLAWRVLQEVVGVGVRTLFLHAGDGRVLFEKVDRPG
jgi:hypothetical protein